MTYGYSNYCVNNLPAFHMAGFIMLIRHNTKVHHPLRIAIEFDEADTTVCFTEIFQQ